MTGLELVTDWGLWGAWGLAMLAVGWRAGLYVGRVRARVASRHLGLTVADGWFAVVRAYRPGVQLLSNGHLPPLRRPEGEWPDD
jgi:hypothetical protein